MNSQMYKISDVNGEEIEATEEEIVEMLREEYVKELEEVIRVEVSLALREGIRDTDIMAQWIEDNF